jgi:hypothetical protein
MRDVRALAWLRWRQFRDGAVYWLRVLGYQPNDQSFSQKMYVVYLLLIGLLWVFMMWSWAFEQTNTIGRLLSPVALADILRVLPILVVIGQVYVVVNALRSTPLKLSFADMAYVAGSPISPVAPVLLGFTRQVLTRAVIVGFIAALFGILVARPVSANLTGIASLRAVAAVMPLVVLTWALAWLIGVARVAYPRVARALWILPFALVALLVLLPDWVLWPGRALTLAIYGASPVWLFAGIIGLSVAFIAALLWLGTKMNMTQVVDESIVYARIQALGLMAYRQLGLQARIRMQQARAARRPRLHLPRATGFAALLSRAAISYVRHPLMLLFSAVWGGAMTQLAVAIIVNNAPIQLWIGWLLAAAFMPPLGVLHVFQSDLEERFLRQFLPVNGFELFIADVLIPLACMIIGALAVWGLQGFPGELLLLGAAFVPVLCALVVLCGAVALTHTRVLMARLIATLAAFGAVAVAGVNFKSPTLALGVAVFAIFLLSSMVAADA